MVSMPSIETNDVSDLHVPPTDAFARRLGNANYLSVVTAYCPTVCGTPLARPRQCK